jgi:putative transposase
MNIFLHKFAIKMANRAVVMVMDGAAWHKSKSLERYKNIKIIIQPPHFPELNPVEKL